MGEKLSGNRDEIGNKRAKNSCCPGPMTPIIELIQGLIVKKF